MKFHENEQKKGTLKIQKSQIAILVLNQSPISAVFPIVRFAGDQKTALTGKSLCRHGLMPNLIKKTWTVSDTYLKPIIFYFGLKIISFYRRSPVSAVFGSPANRTIGKTALIGDWFSTKTAIWDFWIFKVPFFCSFPWNFNDF